MKDCCKKWTGDNVYKIEPLQGDLGCHLCKGDINYCPECGSRLDDKPELPEQYFANPNDLTFDVHKQVANIMAKFDNLIDWLKAKE